MKDVFAESVVQVKPNGLLQAGKMVLMPVTVVLALLGLVFVPVLLVGACVSGLLLFLVTRRLGTEYEYIHTNDEMDIDRVLFGSSRKHLMTVKLEQVELVAQVDSPEVDRYGAWDTKDYSSGVENERTYFMVCRVNGKKLKLKLDLEEKLLKSLSVRIRDKIR